MRDEKKLEPLLIESGPPRKPGADLIRRHAEGLAREIHSDVMAKEDEVADAIEAGIRRFSGRCRSKNPDVGIVHACVRHRGHTGTHLANNGKRWRGL